MKLVFNNVDKNYGVISALKNINFTVTAVQSDYFNILGAFKVLTHKNRKIKLRCLQAIICTICILAHF